MNDYKKETEFLQRVIEHLKKEFTLTSNRCKRDFFLFENAKKYDIKECALMIKND